MAQENQEIIIQLAFRSNVTLAKALHASAEDTNLHTLLKLPCAFHNFNY